MKNRTPKSISQNQKLCGGMEKPEMKIRQMATTILNANTAFLNRTSWESEVNKHGRSEQRPRPKARPSDWRRTGIGICHSVTALYITGSASLFCNTIYETHELAAINPLMETFMTKLNKAETSVATHQQDIDVMKTSLQEQSVKIEEVEDKLTKKERSDKITRITGPPEDETEAINTF